MNALFSLAIHQGTLLVALVIWIGLFLYLLRLDRRITDLENDEGAPSLMDTQS